MLDALINKIKFTSDKYNYSNLENSLPNRLKIVRQAYGLLGKDVAKIIDTIYRNYQNYESGKVQPSANKLAALTLYTGVSLDWLLGMTKAPYYKELIQNIEDNLWNYDENNNPIILLDVYNPILDKTEKIQIYPYAKLSILNDYADIAKRDESYSLAARANIIFLINRFIDMVKENNNSVIIDNNGKIEFHHQIFHAEQVVLQLHYFGLGLPDFALEGVDRLNILERSQTPIFNIEKIHPDTDKKIKEYFSKLNK